MERRLPSRDLSVNAPIDEGGEATLLDFLPGPAQTAEAVADETPAHATAEDATAIAEEVAEGGPVAAEAEEAPAAEAGEEKAEG